MTSKLLKKVYSLNNLEQSWRVIYSNGHFSKSEDVRSEIQRFSEDAASNLRKLQRRLSRGEFKFEPAKGVPIPKLNSDGKPTGKIRPIVLAPVESRLVQRAILNVLVDLPALQPYVKTPLSFGGMRREAARGAAADLPRHEVPSAVPAAIKAALKEIAGGARYTASGDIQSFFTRVPKSHVTQIVAKAANDDDFVALFEQAIAVELRNMAALREKADEFPIEDIGVAQGNSLSPLLGNMILAEFDEQMNSGDCACIRYIDDVLILAPTARAASARLQKASQILGKLGMSLSPEKTSQGATPIRSGFEFLGIQVCPGLIRPTHKAQQKLIAKAHSILEEGRKGFISARAGNPLDRSRSLLAV